MDKALRIIRRKGRNSKWMNYVLIKVGRYLFNLRDSSFPLISHLHKVHMGLVWFPMLAHIKQGCQMR